MNAGIVGRLMVVDGSVEHALVSPGLVSLASEESTEETGGDEEESEQTGRQGAGERKEVAGLHAYSIAGEEG